MNITRTLRNSRFSGRCQSISLTAPHRSGCIARRLLSRVRPPLPAPPTFYKQLDASGRLPLAPQAAASPQVATETSVLGVTTRPVAGGSVTLTASQNPDRSTTITIDTSHVPDRSNLVLHWAVSFSPAPPHDWQPPPPASMPEHSRMFGDGIAARTPIPQDSPLVIHMPAEAVTSEGGPQTLIGIIVRNRDGDQWHHAEDGAGDLQVPLRPPPPPPPPGVAGRRLVERVASEEGKGGMNLFRRYCMINESLTEAFSDPGPGGAAVILAWLRLSASRQLEWYAGGNYQGKDMAHVQKALATRVAEQARGDGLKAHLARMALATLPRGGGDGDAIRMTILDLLRNNGIKEGHRPGIECAFLAQWHQKLHSNTTKDDIAIAEAYLHFLHGSGDWGDFWWYLWEHYKLTKEDLAAMKAGWRTQGITGPACHLPFLIPAVQHLLWVLKVTHSGADVDTSFAMARGVLPGDLQWEIDDLLQNRDAWWVPGKIVQIRERLSPCWRGIEDGSAARSLLLLDISLDTFFRTRLEASINMDTISNDDAASVLELVLQNHCVSSGCTPEAAHAKAVLTKLLHSPPEGLARWGKDWALHAVAVFENVALSVAHVLDTICELTQMPANIFEEKVECVNHKFVLNFGEEIARGHPLYLASPLLRKLQAAARSAAGLGPWEVISAGAPHEPHPTGRVVVQDLAEMQGQEYTPGDEALVVLSKELGGLEDVPQGVVGVLTAAPVDLLSHIAIRARNSGVFLASCSDPAVWESLVRERAGKVVTVAVGGGGGAVDIVDAPEAAAARGDTVQTSEKLSKGAVRLPRVEAAREWALPRDAFRAGVVGGKSLGVKSLAELSGPRFSVPGAVALPYGSFERALKEGPRQVAARFDTALAALQRTSAAGSGLDMAKVRELLSDVREAVMALELPRGLAAEVAQAVQGQGADVAAWAGIGGHNGGGNGVQGAWEAVKAVWASKWTERAFLSRRALGIPEEDLSMAVLCMGLVPAEYAFVLHTQNPLPGSSRDEIFGEVVVGLGETLVGNSPGRAFSFSVPKSDPGNIKVLSLPSKIEAHFAPGEGQCLIARSDSNGEDLAGFAGAGLYESHTTSNTAYACPNYADERLVWDGNFRQGLVAQLVALAGEVEGKAGGPQDIEGCFAGGKAYLLQTRAQV